MRLGDFFKATLLMPSTLSAKLGLVHLIKTENGFMINNAPELRSDIGQ